MSSSRRLTRVRPGSAPADAGLVAAGVGLLEQERRDEGDEVGVAAALAEAVERALHLARPGVDGGERVRDRVAGVVVGVDAEAVAGDARGDHRRRDAPTSAGSVPPLVSQSTTQRAPASSAACRQASA